VSRSRAEAYRVRAQVFLELARSTPPGTKRATLIDSAQTFLQLAEEQGAVTQQQQQIQPKLDDAKE
jgi:hypothetical protein